ISHGESPCAEGRLVYKVSSLTTTWIEIRGFRDTGLNSPGGTRHHVHDDTDTQRQPLSGGAFYLNDSVIFARMGIFPECSDD
ncbi:TPA: hypothetical protein KGU14_RS26430, partial [Escherichia coli]